MNPTAHYRVNGIAQGAECLARQAASAGFRPRKLRFVEQQNAPTLLREIVGGGATGRPCADHDHVMNHGMSRVGQHISVALYISVRQ
jgi:hypothetical protein